MNNGKNTYELRKYIKWNENYLSIYEVGNYQMFVLPAVLNNFFFPYFYYQPKELWWLCHGVHFHNIIELNIE